MRPNEPARCWPRRRELQGTYRSQVRSWLAERTQQARLQDNPIQRMERYLDSAAECELSGNVRAAAAYYRIVLRALPESRQAHLASMALARLETE